MPVSDVFLPVMEVPGWDTSLSSIWVSFYELDYEMWWLKKQTCLPFCHISLKALEEGQDGHGHLGFTSLHANLEAENFLNNKDILLCFFPSS